MKKPKPDPFATIDVGALENVTGGFVSTANMGMGGQSSQLASSSGSGSGHHHHHHHGGSGSSSSSSSNNNGLSPITMTWGGPSGTNGTAQVRNPGRYHPE
jgi:hypothetical protein